MVAADHLASLLLHAAELVLQAELPRGRCIGVHAAATAKHAAGRSSLLQQAEKIAAGAGAGAGNSARKGAALQGLLRQLTASALYATDVHLIAMMCFSPASSQAQSRRTAISTPDLMASPSKLQRHAEKSHLEQASEVGAGLLLLWGLLRDHAAAEAAPKLLLLWAAAAVHGRARQAKLWQAHLLLHQWRRAPLLHRLLLAQLQVKMRRFNHCID